MELGVVYVRTSKQIRSFISMIFPLLQSPPACFYNSNWKTRYISYYTCTLTKDKKIGTRINLLHRSPKFKKKIKAKNQNQDWIYPLSKLRKFVLRKNGCMVYILFKEKWRTSESKPQNVTPPPSYLILHTIHAPY